MENLTEKQWFSLKKSHLFEIENKSKKFIILRNNLKILKSQWLI